MAHQRPKLRSLLAIAFLANTSQAFAQVSPNVPLGDPVYDYVERLADLGLAPGYMRGTRPFSITYAVRIVRRAGELAARRGGPEPDEVAVARDLVERLRAHGRGSLSAGGEAQVAVGRRQEVTSRAVDSPGNVIGYLEPKAGAGAAPAEGLGLALTGRAAAGGYVAGEASGRATFPDGGATADLTRGYVKLGFRALELEAGRDDIAWGFGRSGTMVLSGNARALDQVGVRTAYPVRLPWIFKYLGDVQTQLFLARLDQEVPYGHPYLIGKRLTALPLPWLELGFSQIFSFGGAGAPHFPAKEFLEEFFFGYREDVFTQQHSNSGFAWEVRIRIPRLFELYWEHYFEDCCATLWTRDTSILAGVRRPAVFSRRDDLALEFVATTAITYTHWGAPEHSQEGRVLGHPAGNSAMAAYGIWRYLGRGGGVVRLQLGFDRRSPTAADEPLPAVAPEWRIGGFAEARLPLSGRRAGRVEARARLALERVLAAGFVVGNDCTAGLAEAGVEVSF